jgi:pimeloyl-ACP methyl ester carboxylesterase
VALSLAATAEEVQLPLGKLSLNGNLELPAGGALANGVVLITHGTLAHGAMEIVQGLQELLGERGIPSLAITLSLGVDNRRGMYDCATPHTHRHGDAVEEIGAWLDWLEGRGAKRAVLLGHSRGGNQTAWFQAERQDPRVAGLVLLAPMVQESAGVDESYRKSFGKEAAAPREQARALVAKGEPRALLKPVDILYCRDTAATAESFLSYHAYDPRFRTPDLLGRIRAPVLVLTGGADEVLPRLDGTFAESVRSGQAKLQVIDGADHFFRDLYSEEVADAVKAFLDSLPASP